MSKLERIFEMEPAFDRRDPDPEKNYGIHGAEMRMVVKGEEGAVQFLLFTNWQLPHVRKEQDEKILNGLTRPLDQTQLNVTYHPQPADLGYHSKKPMYEGQEPMGSSRINKEAMKRNTERLIKREDIENLEPFTDPTGTFTPCPYLDGAPCYYDGSGLAAQNVYEILITKGSDAVWEYLENYYEETFHGKQESTGGTNTAGHSVPTT